MIHNNIQYKTGYFYPQSNFNHTNYSNSVNQPNIFTSEETIESHKFDYSKDDGKISTKDKTKNFLKGIVSPITNMFSSPKNFLIGAGMIAGAALLITATGGAAAPILVAAGVVGGGIQFGASTYKAVIATTDDEARAAWQGIGAGTTSIVGSVLGAKSALKGAGVETKGMNALEATARCFKEVPKSFSKSANAFTSGEAVTNVKNIFKKTSNETFAKEKNKSINNDDTLTENISTKQEGEVIKFDRDKVRYDDTGVIEKLEQSTTREPRGTKLDASKIDAKFQEQLKSLGTIEDDGVICIKQSNGETARVNAFIEEINGKKVIHIYDKNNTYIADFYDGAIVTKKNFVNYLRTDNDGNILFGKDFKPEGFSTSELESFYSRRIQELYTKNNGQVKLQDAIDLFPTPSSNGISDISNNLTLSQSNYTISDGCIVRFTDVDNVQWNIRVHSQDITSQNANWILRVSHSGKNKPPTFLDVKNFDFTGIDKNVGSQSSHISIAPFYQGEQALLNDGNSVSFLSFLSQKLNSNDAQLIGKIRSFAFALKDKGAWGTKDYAQLLLKIQKELNLNSIEETLAVIFNYH